MRVSSLVTLVAVVAALLASCSSDDPAPESNPNTAQSTVPITSLEDTPPPTSAAAPSTTEATTTTEAVTTTTVDERAAAGAHYLELVTPLNCSLSIVALVEGGITGDGYFYANDWPEIQAIQPTYATYAQDVLKMMTGLIAFDGWPADVQADVDALIGELAADADYYQTLADAVTFDQWATTTQPESTAASIVRAKLGLETNVGTTRDFCADLAD